MFFLTKNWALWTLTSGICLNCSKARRTETCLGGVEPARWVGLPMKSVQLAKPKKVSRKNINQIGSSTPGIVGVKIKNIGSRGSIVNW